MVDIAGCPLSNRTTKKNYPSTITFAVYALYRSNIIEDKKIKVLMNWYDVFEKL